MKREIDKVRRVEVLYEPIEPLFPADFKFRRRLRVISALGVLLLAALFIFACVMAARLVFSPDRTHESDTEGETHDIHESGDNGIFGDGTSESESESSYIESESNIVETQEGETLEESESSLPSENDIIEVDLSQIEMGEDYIINYSDKAIDAGGLIDRGFIGSEEIGSAEPLILVIHTHTSEAYLSGGSGYRGPSSVVSVGDVLVSKLNLLGLGAVHCSVIHDGGGNNPYANAESTISMMLGVYPSIKYIIDLHRLDLESGGVPIKTVSGCSDGSAQIRLVVGVAEDWSEQKEDISLALSLRGALNRHGRLCMPIVISPSIPNSHMGEYYVMVDVGAAGNSVEEAMAAGDRLAVAFAEVLLN